MMDVELLIEELKLKTRSGTNELYEQHHTIIFRNAHFILRNREDAEEVAHDVLMAIIDNIDEFKKDCSFATWVYEITKNKALEFKIKKNRPMRKTYDPALPGNECLHKTEEAIIDNPENLLIGKENDNAFLNAIKQLPVNQGIAYTLSIIDGLTNLEIRKEMGNISENTVKSLLFKAKKKMEAIFGVMKRVKIKKKIK
jgi:RNA polymerase sigma factor (sigma-70 family)